MTIPDMMQAVVCHAPEDYRLEQVPVPRIGPGEVLVRVKAAGVCASDVKTFVGAQRIWGGPDFPAYLKAPVIPGHEFVGEVVALGEGAAEQYGLALGDKVVSEQIIPCWQCRYCRRGQYWMCQVHNIYGFHGGIDDGAWAEYMRFPAGALNYKVPASVPDDQAALIEPLACAIHAVERGEIKLGDVVVIAGMGPIGLGMLQVAKLQSPGLLIALDARTDRLERASRLGADLVLDVTQEDVVARVRSLTEGYGCDVYIEATGHPAAVNQGLQMIRKLGTYVEFSVMAAPSSVDWSIIGDQKELNIHGSHLGPYRYPLAIDYIAKGIVNAEALISHRFALSQFMEAIDVAHAAQGSCKVLLMP
ncbi:MAG: alcohol dehydrogenase catalytic domain-containing protein [Anaerolineae bacterium]